MRDTLRVKRLVRPRERGSPAPVAPAADPSFRRAYPTTARSIRAAATGGSLGGRLRRLASAVAPRGPPSPPDRARPTRRLPDPVGGSRRDRAAWPVRPRGAHSIPGPPLPRPTKAAPATPTLATQRLPPGIVPDEGNADCQHPAATVASPRRCTRSSLMHKVMRSPQSSNVAVSSATVRLLSLG